MVRSNVNDLLRVIGIKEVALIQLRIENMRLRQALQAKQDEGTEKAKCENCQGCAANENTES